MSPTEPKGPRRKQRLRLLLVDDDDQRGKWFSERVEGHPHIRLVWAKNGGAAIEIVKRDEPTTWAGLMLDHDMDKHANDRSMVVNGQKVAEAVTRHVDTATPVLVHSTNPSGGAAMVGILRGAGFEVTRIMFGSDSLTPEAFAAWLSTVQAYFDEMLDEDDA